MDAWCAVAEQVDHVCWGNDVELMNKAACRRYGLTRADVDRLFDRAPLFSPPDSGSVYVRRDVLEAWVADHTATRPGTRP